MQAQTEEKAGKENTLAAAFDAAATALAHGECMIWRKGQVSRSLPLSS